MAAVTRLLGKMVRETGQALEVLGIQSLDRTTHLETCECCSSLLVPYCRFQKFWTSGSPTPSFFMKKSNVG